MKPLRSLPHPRTRNRRARVLAEQNGFLLGALVVFLLMVAGTVLQRHMLL